MITPAPLLPRAVIAAANLRRQNVDLDVLVGPDAGSTNTRRSDFLNKGRATTTTSDPIPGLSMMFPVVANPVDTGASTIRGRTSSTTRGASSSPSPSPCPSPAAPAAPRPVAPVTEAAATSLSTARVSPSPLLTTVSSSSTQSPDANAVTSTPATRTPVSVSQAPATPPAITRMVVEESRVSRSLSHRSP
ncbi:hypothetical protein HDU96_000911 [Phlyctochytrium bullatum]|nr:hypothetical protein HDU96_000911 [Phlyctochytrium bullatum]